MVELDTVSIRRILGLRDQPLRKNEKLGVGRAQIVLTEEQAAKIYSLRCMGKSMHPLLHEVSSENCPPAELHLARVVFFCGFWLPMFSIQGVPSTLVPSEKAM
jgi:hypothetical protein